MPTTIAACQTPYIKEDVNASLQCLKQFTEQAIEKNASLICFPECFLQGHLTELSVAKKYAIDLCSELFKNILEQLSIYKAMIIVGLIELDNDRLFNTAVVIQQGRLIGKYRKIHLLKGEGIFTAGDTYPVFRIGDMIFGINICYDTQFPESCKNIAQQGAALIVCPSNNMMRYETAEKFKHLHHKMRIERVMENKIWMLSADVTGEQDGRISYGPTSVINPFGEIVVQVPLLETGMVVANVN